MKVLLTLWISAALIQEVVPNALGRFPRQAPNASSYLHTEYEAKIEQKGKHGNESFGTMSGKQAIEHDNCNDNWNAFANKCAALIKDLVASLANAVSSKPGDTTNLQLQIKNTFRHFDNTHNCSCLNQTGNELADMDLSHLLDNLTLSTTAPVGDAGDGDSLGEKPKKLTPGTNPENEEDPNSTSNSRRQANHPNKSNNIVAAPVAGQGQPLLTSPKPSSECSDCKSDVVTTTPPLYFTNKNSPLQSSSSVKSPHPDGSGQPETNPTSQAPVEIKPAVVVTPTKNGKTGDGPTGAQPQTSIPSQTVTKSVPQVKITTDPTPENNHDQPNSDSLGHATGTSPKHDALGTTDPHSYESPDYEAAAPAQGNQPTIPLTNSNSNIPESSEPITSDKSLSSGQSNPPDVVVIPDGSTPDYEITTPACDETSGAETVTVPLVLATDPTETDEVHITPRPVIGSQAPVVENQTPSVYIGTTPQPYPSDELTATQIPVEVVPQNTEEPQQYDDESDEQTTIAAIPVVSTGTTEKCDDENSEPSAVTIVPVVATTEQCDDETSTPAPVEIVPVVASSTTEKCDDETSTPTPVEIVPVVETSTTEKCDDETSTVAPVEVVPVVTTEKTEKYDDDDDDDDDGDDDTYQTTVIPVVSTGTTEKCDDETSTVPPVEIVPVVATTEKCDDETSTPAPVEIVPVVATGTTEKCDDETSTVPPVEIVPVVNTGTTEKCDDDNIEHTTVAVVPVEPSDGGQNQQGSQFPVADDTTEVPVKTDDHTEVSESPVLVQPTTFQTTSEEPTHPPVSTQAPIILVPVTTASTPQDSDEGTTLESKHHSHDDDEDDEDDCCSCEACTEEDNSDPKKVRENVCKSLEEARRELKSIFDKIKKKLRCCRKLPSTITTNTSPLPQ